MVVSFKDALIVDVLLAVASHIWFKKHEPNSILLVLLTLAGLSIPSAFLLVPHLGSPFPAFCVAFTALVMTLLESMSIYRLSPFHPLAKYPGPWQCKLTKLWGAYIAWKGKPHLYYKGLHDQYGPVVRIGPNELSIVDVSLIPNILGSSGMPKGPMYEGRRILPSKNFNINNSLLAVRDLRRHAKLRRPWNAAFKPSSVANYEELVITRAEQFMSRLKEVSCSLGGRKNGVDFANWVNYFTFDLVGDLAFGGVYSLLVNGDPEAILPTVKRGLYLPSISQHVPWFLGVLRRIPFLGKDVRAFGLFGVEQGKKRAALANSIKRKDLFYYLLEDDPSAATNPLPKIVANSLLAIVAGSDTSTSALSNMLYYILRDPDYLVRLRAEIDDAYPPSDPNETINLNSLSSLPLLNAVINETLRLQPPVASSLQRAPALGSGGKALSADIYIPEGTAVQVPPYALHRSPQYFSPYPDKFWPERWLSRDPSVVLDRAAFIPFSTGPANCPGKPLAMLELRYLMCLLLRTFDISFSDGYDPARWEEGLLDRFVMLKGKLPIKLEARKT